MINSLHQTKSEGVDGSLTNLLINEELESIQMVGDHVRTVATAFSQFPLNNHQCDTCLRHVGKPIFSEADFIAFLHATDHSRKTLYDSLWKRTQDQVNSEIQQAYATEIKSQQARIEGELLAADARYRVVRESEIKGLTERTLDKFSNEYFNSRRQAMCDSVDLSIKREKDSLLHQRQAELLPLSTSLMLTNARQALDEGLAESANANPTDPQLTQHTMASQALPGASQLDSVIANLSNMILAKINNLAELSSARVDRLTTALKFRLIRLECNNKD
jgi:hypothetical protein